MTGRIGAVIVAVALGGGCSSGTAGGGGTPGAGGGTAGAAPVGPGGVRFGGDPPGVFRRVSLGPAGPTWVAVVVDLETPMPLRLRVGAPAGPPAFAAESPAAMHHEIVAHGLGPATRYPYALWTPAEELSSAPDGRPLELSTPGGPGDACFLAIADLQHGDGTPLLAELEAVGRGVGFVLTLGDNVSGGEPWDEAGVRYSYHDWFFTPLVGLTAFTAIYPTIGNHDVGNGSLKGAERARGVWRALMAAPLNGPRGFEETAYSFDRGPFHVVVLDSLDRRRGKATGNIAAEELAWLDADLAAAAAARRPWTIVALHHQILGWEAPPGEEQREWFRVANAATVHAVLARHRVALVLSGHRHYFNRLERDGVTYVTVPTLAADRVLFGHYGNDDHANLGGGEGLTLARARGNTFGYAMVCADAETLRAEVVGYQADAAGLVPAELPPTVLAR